MTDTLVDIPKTPPDKGADVVTADISPDILMLCDPWLQHLWGLRGTYNGTLIDFGDQPCSTSGETGGKLEQRETPCQTSVSAPAKAATDP